MSLEGCEEKMDRPSHFSLECRRLKCDLIQVYKIMRGIDKPNNSSIFP